MAEQLYNRFVGTLVNLLASDDATFDIEVSAGTLTPQTIVDNAIPVRLTIDDEILTALPTSLTDGVMTLEVIARGQEDTTAAAHNAGASVENFITVEGLTQSLRGDFLPVDREVTSDPIVIVNAAAKTVTVEVTEDSVEQGLVLGSYDSAKDLHTDAGRYLFGLVCPIRSIQHSGVLAHLSKRVHVCFSLPFLVVAADGALIYNLFANADYLPTGAMYFSLQVRVYNSDHTEEANLLLSQYEAGESTHLENVDAPSLDVLTGTDLYFDSGSGQLRSTAGGTYHALVTFEVGVD